MKVPSDGRNALPESRLHPLAPIIELAQQQQQHIRDSVLDYTCVLVKRERIEGELLPTEQMLVKFRSPRDVPERPSVPFSVYFRVIAPKRIVNREILYVENQHFGSVVVTRGGRRNAQLTMRVDPLGHMAMRDNKYPITSFGLDKLLERLIEVANEDMEHDECDVRVLRGAKLDGRSCTVYEVLHPVHREHFRFHLAQVFLDDELRVPVRFVSFGWPESDNGEPVLLEEYTYRQLRLNVGLTDADFDIRNPEYGFRDR